MTNEARKLEILEMMKKAERLLFHLQRDLHTEEHKNKQIITRIWNDLYVLRKELQTTDLGLPEKS